MSAKEYFYCTKQQIMRKKKTAVQTKTKRLKCHSENTPKLQDFSQETVL